jgi:Putative transposase DNA-binding domain.
MLHYTLTQYIKYKPRFAGIGVKVVNEYNTSQTCWWCGEKEDASGSVKLGISVTRVGR